MILNFREWKTFSTLEALTYIRITLAFGPMVPQVLGVTTGSRCAHGVAGIIHGKVRNTHPHQMKSMPTSTILVVGHTNFQFAIFFWCRIMFSLKRYPHNAFSNLTKSQRCQYKVVHLRKPRTSCPRT